MSVRGTEYAREAYWREREAVIHTNRGSDRVSMICVLPDTPQRPWGDVSALIAAFPSPTRFLAYLFVDVACPGQVRPPGLPTITFDGILGSAGAFIDPWALLPAIGVWTTSPHMVHTATRHLKDAIDSWHGGSIPASFRRERLPDPDILCGFVPYGKVPHRRLVEMFLAEVAPLLLRSAAVEC
jgi:hypothetical protein